MIFPSNHHDEGRALCWGVARTPDGPRCAVFCLRCRVALARDLKPYEAREFINDYRESGQ